MKEFILKGSLCSVLALVCSCATAPVHRANTEGELTAMDAFQRQWKAADDAYISQNQPIVTSPTEEEAQTPVQEEGLATQNQPEVEAPAPEKKQEDKPQEEGLATQKQPEVEAPAPKEKPQEEGIATQKQPEVPTLLSTRRRLQPEAAAQEPATVSPTEEQSKAAIQLLNTPVTPQQNTGAISGADANAPLPGNGRPLLRAYMRPEEATSTQDAEAPQPNSVELRGLRSPEMPNTLPMNIDGKLLHQN